MLLGLAKALDSLGLRSLVAKAASLAYGAQSFSVDSDGDWVNAQADAVIVSPIIHTWSYPHFRADVLDNWCRHYTPREGDIVVDLGSGLGEEVLVFSKLIGEGRLLAVEAFPDTFRCLRKTITRSGLDNVRAIECAVGAVDGKARLSTVGSYQSNSLFGDGEIEVPQATLDTLSADLPRIDFLRSNIEGAERLMLEGMRDTIGKVRNACISCHDFMGRPAKRAVTDFFSDHDFEIILRDGPPPQGDFVYARRKSD